MLNDALESEPDRHEQLTADDKTFFDWWRQILQDGHGQVLGPAVPLNVRIIARSFWLSNDNRAFFTTQQGYMGFGPPEMKQGDLVAVLLGSRMPFILRQTPPAAAIIGKSEGNCNRTYYSVVGYCYLHGMMHGEAVSEKKIADICEINLI